MATKQELASAKLIDVNQLSIIKDYIDDKPEGFSAVVVGDKTIEATTDSSVKITAGKNIAIEADATKNEITINGNAAALSYMFEVDTDGNLVVISEDETAPEGFSISEDGYLVFEN